MTITVTDRGGAAESVSDTSFARSPTANLAAGPNSCLFVIAQWDNSLAGGGDPFSSLTDSKGNTYKRLVNRAAGDAATANAGFFMGVWYTEQNVGTLTTSDSVTLTLTANTTVKTMQLYEVTAAAGSKPFSAGLFDDGNSTEGVAVTSRTITGVSTAVGQANLGVTCLEQSQTLTADSDTTNGSWSAQITRTAGTGVAGLRQSSQWKVQTTTTSTQTYNTSWSTACDANITIVRVYEKVIKDFTGKAATSTSAKAIAVARARGLTGKAATATSAKAELTVTEPTGVARAFDGKAALSFSAKATTVVRARGLTGKAATATSAQATTVGRGRPLVGKAATATSARATTVGRGRPLAGKAAVATSARATTASTARRLTGKASIATAAEAVDLRRNRGYVSKAALTSSAHATSARVVRRLSGRSATATSAKALLTVTGIARVEFAGSAASVFSARAGMMLRARRLVARAGFATSARALPVQRVRDLIGKASTSTSAKATVRATRPLTATAPFSSSARALLTVRLVGGRPYVWTGVQWVEFPVRLWTGVEWVEYPMKVYDGADWVAV